jgi:hypothetical protein
MNDIAGICENLRCDWYDNMCRQCHTLRKGATICPVSDYCP